MTVIVVAACPFSLRGHLTRWATGIAPAVFIGKISTRVRELTWQHVINMAPHRPSHHGLRRQLVITMAMAATPRQTASE